MNIIVLALLGKWTSPTVTGERPPPGSGFTVTHVGKNKAILYGGYYPQHGGCLSDIYMIEMTAETVVSNTILEY